MSNSIKIGKHRKFKTGSSPKTLVANKGATGYLSDHFVRVESKVDQAFRQAHRDSTELVEILPDPLNDVCLFVDDDRPCPEGWQLARSIWDFKKLLDQDKEVLDRVSHISFDWNMGMGNPDGMTLVEYLAMEIDRRRDNGEFFLPNLKEIYFHSSDKEMAMKMRYHLVKIMEDVDDTFKDRVRLRLRQW